MSGEEFYHSVWKKGNLAVETNCCLYLYDSPNGLTHVVKRGVYTSFFALEQSDIHQTVYPHETSYKRRSKLRSRSWQAWSLTSFFEWYFTWKTAIGTITDLGKLDLCKLLLALHYEAADVCAVLACLVCQTLWKTKKACCRHTVSNQRPLNASPHVSPLAQSTYILYCQWIFAKRTFHIRILHPKRTGWAATD